MPRRSPTLRKELQIERKTPRVEIVPPGIAGSYGLEAIELAEHAGLILDQWQKDAVIIALSYRKDGRWACFEYCEWVPRQNGKGAILECLALAFLFLLPQEQMLMWSAHLYSTAQQSFKRMMQLLENLEKSHFIPKDFIKVVKTNGEQGFVRYDTKQEIRFSSRSIKFGRGFTADRLFIDEALFLDSDQLSTIIPILMARPNPSICYTSTPPLAGDSPSVMFDLRRRSESPDPGSMGYRDWGLGLNLEHLGDLDVSNIETWKKANPACGTRIALENLENVHRASAIRKFAHEHLGVWPEHIDGGGVIDIDLWKKLGDEDSKRIGDIVFGVDISPRRDYAVIVGYSVRADGLGHAQIIQYHPGTEWVVNAMKKLQDEFAPIAWAIGRGTYLTLRESLMRMKIAPISEGGPKRGDACVVGGQDMAAACGQIIDAVKQRSFRHTAQVQLDGAVIGAKIRQTGDTIAWSRKDSEADISPLVAVTIARWAFYERLDAVRKPPSDPLQNIW